MTPPRATLGGQRLKVLMLIRLALLLGVLAFGGMTYALHSRAMPPADPATARLLLFTFYGLMLATFPVVIFFRVRRARAATEEQVATVMIAGWAIGEGVALFGTVRYFLTGDPTSFVLGVIYLGVVMVILPLRDPA
jgi:FtsH-binding integral membrane protein